MKRAGKPVGELALVEQIRRDFAGVRGKQVALGIGDDCAILRPPAGSEIVVTTDFSLEGRHFLRSIHQPESAGHRTLARGLSDLAAMGATPLAAFLSLALPGELLTRPEGRRWLKGFFDGLRSLGRRYNVPLAGGDTSQSPGEVLADIVLIGATPKGKALRRSGAKPGDVLYVSGHLGGAAAELAEILARKKSVKAGSAKNRPHLYPEPRLATGRALLARNLATACIDISDGLSTDLAHLCRASGVHAEIEQSALPLHPLARRLDPEAALHAALHGGEDYELLFSAPAKARIPKSMAGVPITRIGQVTRKRAGQPLMTLVKPDKTRAPLQPSGWEHFASARGTKLEAGS